MSSRFKSFRTYAVCPRTQYKILSQARKFLRKGLKLSLGCWTAIIRSSLTLDHLFEIRKVRSFEKAEEGEPEETNMAVLISNVGLWLIEPGVSMFDNVDSNEQREATTIQGITRRFWERMTPLYLSRLQCLFFSSHLQGFVHDHICCWTLDIRMFRLQVRGKYFLLKWSFVI
jgi:hypothetical protein